MAEDLRAHATEPAEPNAPQEYRRPVNLTDDDPASVAVVDRAQSTDNGA